MNTLQPKKLSWIISSTFRVFFKRFFKNTLWMVVLMLIAGILAIPYIISVFSLGVNTGYPFADITTGNIISLVLGIVLLIFATYIVLPSLKTGYFAPYTTDVLEGKTRETKEQKQIVLNSFRRVASATFCQLLLFSIPIILLGLFGFLVFKDIPIENLLYESVKIGSFILLYLISLVVIMILVIFTFFTRLVAFFENKTGFGAVFESMRLISQGNFWRTLGHLIVISLIISIGTNLIMTPVVLILSAVIGVFGAMVIGAWSLLVLLMLIPLLVLVVVVILISGIAYGLMEVAACHLYFNARANSEGIPFPEEELSE